MIVAFPLILVSSFFPITSPAITFLSPIESPLFEPDLFAAPSEPNLNPHSPQNFMVRGHSLLQLGQKFFFSGNFVPQFPQNFISSGFSSPQFGHFIILPQNFIMSYQYLI